MNLDHATILTRDIESDRNFFCAIAGLEEGPRPPFRVHGYWLYAQGRAVIHLIDASQSKAERRGVSGIDHIAFRVDSATEWEALIARMQVHSAHFEITHVPLSHERQLFVELTGGVLVEFVIALLPTAQ